MRLAPARPRSSGFARNRSTSRRRSPLRRSRFRRTRRSSRGSFPPRTACATTISSRSRRTCRPSRKRCGAAATRPARSWARSSSASATASRARSTNTTTRSRGPSGQAPRRSRARRRGSTASVSPSSCGSTSSSRTRRTPPEATRPTSPRPIGRPAGCSMLSGRAASGIARSSASRRITARRSAITARRRTASSSTIRRSGSPGCFARPASPAAAILIRSASSTSCRRRWRSRGRRGAAVAAP